MRICVHDQFIWGLQPSIPVSKWTGQIWASEFLPLWCEDWDFVLAEFGKPAETNGLVPSETNTAVEATEINTPPEAWVALAYFRLTGQRQNDSEFVKE